MSLFEGMENIDIKNAVYKKWKSKSENIRDFRVANHQTIRDVRFVLRDGEKVLQKEVLVWVYFKEKIFNFGGWTDKDSNYVWIDVPTIEDEE